jgi:glucose/arabinose dehydrogenase
VRLINQLWSRAAAPAGAILLVCGGLASLAAQSPSAKLAGIGPAPALPAPLPDEDTTKFAMVAGWPENLAPKAPDGFQVEPFARDLDSPRWLYVLPNGDVLVSQARSHPSSTGDPKKRKGMAAAGNLGVSPNRLTLLRDSDKDGRAETRHMFLENLNQPLGMTVVGDALYVANTDGLLKFPYMGGQTSIDDPGALVLEFPAGGYNNHWTRNILVNADRSKLYIAIGSASNAGEFGMDKEVRRANILEINLDGSGERVFAAGLRNPVGMGWQPDSGRLWTVVNERDGLGDDLVPDYLTAVQDSAFYGWPYAYYGTNVDPRRKGERPDLVARTVAPDYALGSHTASLGLSFYNGRSFPARYRGGAFIGQHGSWNRSEFSGYRVVFVPFKNGRPQGEPEDFLTGFMADAQSGKTYGRPVGIAELPDGSLLVADDAGGVVWRVSAAASR